MRKILICAVLLLNAASGTSACENNLPLSGVESVSTCSKPGPDCIPAPKALYDYAEKMQDDPETFYAMLHASPWRFYDADRRILTLEEMAASIKPSLTKQIKRVVLVASWTGVPTGKSPSLASSLSKLLGGMPVDGMDGFVWFDQTGKIKTTRNAFTLTKGGGAYYAPVGAEVMASFVLGWPAKFEDQYMAKNDPDGLLYAAVGWDVFMLCPDHALQTFEKSAQLGNSIAAYNAALIHLEKQTPASMKLARKLLQQAASAGDKKAQAKLLALDIK